MAMLERAAGTSDSPARSMSPGSPFDSSLKKSSLPGLSAIPALAQDRRDAPRILLIGDDPVLRNTREAILHRAGYETLSFGSTASLSSLIIEAIRLALICRSVSTVTAQALASTIHAVRPNLPILRLAKPDEPELLEFAKSFKTILQPDLLLAQILELLKSDSSGEPATKEAAGNSRPHVD